MEFVAYFVAKMIHMLLNGLGIFNQLIENKIILGNGCIVMVANECTGYRSIISLTIVTVVLCLMDKIRLDRSIFLVSLAPVIAFIGNLVRVTTVTLLANWYPNLSLGLVHEYSGYVIFIFNLLIIFYIGGLLSKKLK